MEISPKIKKKRRNVPEL